MDSNFLLADQNSYIDINSDKDISFQMSDGKHPKLRKPPQCHTNTKLKGPHTWTGRWLMEILYIYLPVIKVKSLPSNEVTSS